MNKLKKLCVIGLWTIIAGVAGYFLFKVAMYWQQLFRQPRLKPVSLPPAVKTYQTLAAKAQAIAEANLQSGIEKRQLSTGAERLVLCAGRRNFREPWARDFGFAGFGLADINQLQAMRETLEVFLAHQHASGQFPVKIHSTSVLDRYLHSLFGREQPTRAALKPKYTTAHNTISLDGNALLVVAFLNYVNHANDGSFAKIYWPALKKAVSWIEGHALESDGLLHQAPFADWADSVARQGKILYPNVVYWKALHDLSKAAPRYGQPGDAEYFAARADQIKQAINEHFWRDELGYYVTSQQFEILSSAGNLLAVAWGLASPEQSHAILDSIAAFEMANPVPTQVTHRPYPAEFIAIENRLGGIGHYHTSAAWLWLGGWHIIALTRVGRMQEAETLLERIAYVIARDGAVHEVYDSGGHYLSTFWYTSEAPLTWSAGMVTHAFHKFQRRRIPK